MTTPPETIREAADRLDNLSRLVSGMAEPDTADLALVDAMRLLADRLEKPTERMIAVAIDHMNHDGVDGTIIAAITAAGEYE